jgi:hypothetical protein
MQPDAQNSQQPPDEAQSWAAVSSIPLVRPVRCWFCNQQMHYAGDPRHEPEVRVEVHTDAKIMRCFSEFYAHVRCWSAAIAPNDQAEARRERKS